MEKLDVNAIVNKLRKFENVNIQPVLTNVDTETQVDGSFIVAVTIGGAIAYHLPLPAEPVAVVGAYFAEKFNALLDETLSAINEQFPIRTMVAYDAALNNYRIRYNMLHGGIEGVNNAISRMDFSGSHGNNLSAAVGVELMMDHKDDFDSLIKSINLTCSSANNYKGIFI